MSEGPVEFVASDETVGDSEIAIHDGHVGGLERKGAPGGAVDERVETGAEVFVVGDEIAGLLIGGGTEGASTAVADAGRTLPVS
jgi:hypothetical protein